MSKLESAPDDQDAARVYAGSGERSEFLEAEEHRHGAAAAGTAREKEVVRACGIKRDWKLGQMGRALLCG